MRRSRDRDRLHLLHMRDAAQWARDGAIGHSRNDLDTNRHFQLGLVKAVELVDECASRISEELRTQQTSIPWSKMISMRDVLVHNYWRVEPDTVWNVVQKDIPVLLIELERLIELEEERRME